MPARERRRHRAAPGARLQIGPSWSLAHVRRLTDATGIVEHALGAVPNASEGYTLDDNARALVAVVRYHRSTRDPESLDLAVRYLSFILYCQTADGWFHNDVGWDRRFLDTRATGDPVGRAIWALGESVAGLGLEGLWIGAARALGRTLPWAPKLSGLRPVAFALLGIRALVRSPRARLRAVGDGVTASALKQMAAELAERLVSAYHRTRRDEWPWFEDRLTYANARLPQALVAAWEVTGHGPFLEVAVASYRFLWDQLWNGAYLDLVGNRGWWVRGQARARYDQQPVDAGAMAEAAASLYLATGHGEYLTQAERALEWFYGRNALGAALYDEATGGCRDGLGPDGVNANEGAESTLAHLLARMAVEEARRRAALPRTRAMA